MNINKQALDAWLDKQHKVSRAEGEPDRASAYWHVKHEIQSGRFDAPSDDRLRSLLERLDSYIDFSEHLSPGDWGIEDVTGINSLFDEMREALSTTEPTGPSINSTRLMTEPTGAERVRELWRNPMAAGAYRAGIRDTLSELGIIIPGINAPEKEDKTCVMCRRREGVNLSTAHRWYCQPCTDALPSVDKEETDA